MSRIFPPHTKLALMQHYISRPNSKVEIHSLGLRFDVTLFSFHPKKKKKDSVG
jgi:hypothetical protein